MSAAFYQDEVKFYVAVDCIILGFNKGVECFIIQTFVRADERTMVPYGRLREIRGKRE